MKNKVAKQKIKDDKSLFRVRFFMILFACIIPLQAVWGLYSIYISDVIGVITGFCGVVVISVSVFSMRSSYWSFKYSYETLRDYLAKGWL